jgi:hypothetical protein
VRIGAGCTGGKSLRQPLDTSHEVDPKSAFEQCPVQRGPPRAPDRLGFEVDGLGSLDHDPERTAADGRDADLRSASDGDRTDRVAEQSEVGEGAQVGDAMLPVAESGSDSEVEVVGGGRGVERTERADGVMPAPQPVDQAVVLQASEGVGGGGRRTIERGPGFVEGELLLALGNEGVDQFRRAGHRYLLASGWQKFTKNVKNNWSARQGR